MYTYYKLLNDVEELSRAGIKTGVVGRSGLGRPIPYARFGSRGGRRVIVTAGIHAREHVSSLLVSRQMSALAAAADRFAAALKSGGIYFVPMLNPDGNLLVYGGADTVPDALKKPLIALNGGSDDFSLWKADCAGVDLNTNFDARWGTGAQNVFAPAPANYVGTAPFDRPETRILRDFTLKVDPAATISYHALGREIYWRFGQSGAALERDRRIAEFVNAVLRYDLIDGGDGFSSAGGYKDWCVSVLKIPSLTIELVPKNYSHPLLDDACIADDFVRNEFLPVRLLQYLITTDI
ncbi:MAG: hypothetical protein LBP26_03010 [Clostridiales bacterium]|nr:hypothetical protein [Clostridiales bacterium]